jgi:hypothetical protein
MAPLPSAQTADLWQPAAASASRWTVLASLPVAQLTIVLDATIVNIALASAQRALHFSCATGSRGCGDAA